MSNKLHLGCGKIKIPGYLNVDIMDGDAVDLVADIRDLPLEKNHYDVIYSCAAIEHFGRKEWIPLLQHWFTFLKPGGKIYLSTSDFDALVEQYQKDKNLGQLLGLLIGGQKDDYDWHGMVFNFDVLKNGLEQAGFKNVETYDWRNFDVGQMGIDDFSQAYIPHMDKENGKLMVLNMTATKPQ